MNERLLVPGIRFPTDIEPWLRLAERGVGGFCLFGAPAPRELERFVYRLQSAAPHPLLIAADLEQGAGQNIAGLAHHPCAAAMDADAAEAAGARTALEARPAGITMTFAPVCDLLSNRDNPIIQGRAFSDPASFAPRFIEGAHRFGLKTCAKHFPGHGATGKDSHEELPSVHLDASRDLPPFAAAFDAGVDAVMSAHVAYPNVCGDLCATLSRAVMTDLLRGEMGFLGLLITDALLMEGVRGGRTEAEASVLAIEAGCDVVLFPDDIEGVLGALNDLDGSATEASLARMAVAAEALPDPLGSAAARSVRVSGELPMGPGPHPLRICDLHGEGAALAEAAGVLFTCHGPDGEVTASGGVLGLEAPCVAIIRQDRAWSGPLGLPGPIRALAEGVRLLILVGSDRVAEGLSAPSVIRAPGQDPATLNEVVRRAFALNYPDRSS